MVKPKVKKIIVGLGNPGKEFENTYHNAGRLALLMLEGASSKAWENYKDIFEYLEMKDAILIRPLTYMNDSGKAVRAALKKFNAQPKDLTVIHDDSDLTIGNYKLSFARNSAGHKGVQSIIDTLKTNEFTRARIGIRPAREIVRKKASEFALKKISAKDLVILKKVVEDQFAYKKLTENE